MPFPFYLVVFIEIKGSVASFICGQKDLSAVVEPMKKRTNKKLWIIGRMVTQIGSMCLLFHCCTHPRPHDIFKVIAEAGPCGF